MGRPGVRPRDSTIRMGDALMRLLEGGTPFERLSVTQLCREAQVNRSTFYAHYDNLQDLLVEVTDGAMGEFWAPFAGLGKAGMALRDGKYLGTYLEFVKEHQPLFRASMRSPRSFDIEGLYRRIEEGVSDDFDSRGIDSPSDRRYLLQFYLTGITAITVRWVEGGCAESVEHMVTLISSCIPKA